MERANPRWETDEALRRGESADRLLDKHNAVLTPRLPEGTGAQLKADLATLAAMSPGAVLGNQKTATATEREIAADAHDLIMVFRLAVQRSENATESLRAALRVGEPLSDKVTQDVLDALAVIAARATELLACGASQADIEEAASLAARLQAADQSQKSSKGARAGATEDRIDVQLRVEAAIDAIYVAGMFAFRRDPAIRQRFERLVSASGPQDDVEEGDARGGGRGGDA